MRRGSRGFDHLTKGLSGCRLKSPRVPNGDREDMTRAKWSVLLSGSVVCATTKGLANCRIPRAAGSPPIRGLSFCRDSSFSSWVRSSRERSGLLPGFIVLSVGQSLAQKVWPFVVRRAGEGLGRKGLSFCPDSSFSSQVRSAHQRSRKRSGHLSIGPTVVRSWPFRSEPSRNGLSLCRDPSWLSMVWSSDQGTARGLSIYRIPGTSGSPRVTKGLSFCRDPSFSSQVRSAHQRSGHLSAFVVG
jgi:hypothetical protein